MTTNTITECQGNVRSITDHKSVTTDSQPWRTVDVSITRCTACAGSATVTDTYSGIRWIVALPSDYARDDEMAAYWAAEASIYAEPVYTPEPEETINPAYEEADYEVGPFEDEDGSEAFGRCLERRAEEGTWFGRDDRF